MGGLQDIENRPIAVRWLAPIAVRGAGISGLNVRVLNALLQRIGHVGG